MRKTRKFRAAHRLPIMALVGAILAPVVAPARLPQSQSKRLVPVVATQLSEQYEKQGDQTTLAYERVAAYLRRGDGSQYIRLTSVVGQMPESATIVDRASGEVWMIEYGPRKAILTNTFPPGPLLPKDPTKFRELEAARGGQSLGVKEISGVDCEGWQMPSTGPNHPAAEIWFAPSLNFLIVESKIEQGNKETINLLQNIQAEREPAPSFFRAPKGFEIVK